MKKELLRSKIFLAGAGLLVVGASPLLLYVLYALATGATGGNPIGLGLLFFVSFWPAVILMGIGAVQAARRAKQGGGPL
ncbi:MAG: hypothetical protein A2X32_03215 [Elusimicrobia bacterium GWC2_64_44]|nr:MAG: hypothetical protein A2X32_03215 [Elusimicrobia bacterium GWC2_64_44]